MVLNLTNKPPEWEKIQTTNKMVKSNKNVNVTYKGVTYDVELNNSSLLIGGSYICPFELDCIGFDDEKTLLEAVYDCVGGWVEGYEMYSLQANQIK